ncbi:MAG: TRAP transporter substrate-binding protein DctP [Hoeflea sp.]|uniref:TRAP transporter substrate-binding protein DctP n=1 Tax=Hoeflea sp. TaxID=1940281 RepID=UPI001D7C9A7A|nr:TRAP transporter substrate-binding protein DctP [Hoeflea sp.]MBU4528991.1 TRAP transporter substrate-binding protein DctP [Alphaproteobacteria bacterium]MBU4543396.1 TRAP transporter substrate-binding protein DctP [Alphaproteobacteria bacterium]MBU4549021.1 TRAP transporter substrate-binding protein DctP [Alphaproteobacteria bacterium]MBV1725156.1 TRAP transporter substrate-binding protein DctP [Hoeflea sp.]MBV1785117.1 TRAP transporter substrate-binding protein DctP [Hoeflea sp.]
MWKLMCLAVGLSAATALAAGGVNAQERTLRISHQFPSASSLEEGDFRDRLAKMFAAEVEKRTNGKLSFDIYPASSLVKPHPQFTGMQSGSLDLSVFPMAYATTHAPAVGVALLPGLVTSYEQALAWEGSEIGDRVHAALQAHGVRMLAWGWQAGASVSTVPQTTPEEVAGTKVRGPGREVNFMLAAAGGGVTSIPSSETYSAMQSGVLDAVWTVPTSLISFRLHEFAKHATPSGESPMWFAAVPLLMSEATFDSLTPEQQQIFIEVGHDMDEFAVKAAKEDDERFASVFRDAGAEIHAMDAETIAAWQALAKESSWVEFANSVEDGQELIDLATQAK